MARRGKEIKKKIKFFCLWCVQKINQRVGRWLWDSSLHWCRNMRSAFDIIYFTFSLSMASSPPGVDMIRSWMLVTDVRPPWLLSAPEDGEAVREPIGAVEKWPGRWFSEAIKYLCLLFWMSLRSEPTIGEREKEEENNREGGGIDPGYRIEEINT